MKIFLVNYTDAGIHEPRGTKIAASLAKKGHKVVWIHCEEKGRQKIPGVRFQKISVLNVPFRAKEMLFLVRAFHWIVRNQAREKFNVGLGFSHVGGVAAYLVNKRIGLPYAFDYPDPLYPADASYSKLYSPIDRLLAGSFEKVERKALLRAAFVAAISPFFARFLHNRYGVPLSRIFVAPNAPDSYLFKPAKPKYRDFTLSYSGKAIPEYGLGWLLENFAKTRTNAKLLLVVKTEGNWSNWLQNEIMRLGIKGRTIVFENVLPAKVSELIGKSHVAVFPYPRGKINDYALPNKLLEYFALGLPVICRDLPEAAQIIRKHGCGRVVSENHSLDAALFEMKRTGALDRMEANARKLALEEYDWRKIAIAYEQQLRKISLGRK